MKIGDKVICYNVAFLGAGEIIIDYANGNVEVKFDGQTRTFNKDELDYAEPTPHNEGIKFDNGKPDLTDIPLEAMWEMGRAFTFGQKKYSKGNFRNGMLVSRQLAAAIRHIYQHLDGETIDIESGAMHLGNALASISMAIYNLKNNPQFDDRFQKDKDKHDTKN